MVRKPIGRTRRWTFTAAGAVLAAPMLFAGPAAAGPRTSPCRTAGHPAQAIEIVARSQTAAAGVNAQLSWMQVEYDKTTPASPAQRRLREELDRLEAEANDLQKLGVAASARADATSGSPAQFRAQEELDSLCDALTGPSADPVVQ